MDFELHPNLQLKPFICDLALSRVLLQDESHYPWIFLVPRRRALRIIDLPQEEQALLMQELDLAQRIIWNEFSPTQINVAAIGNKTPQLHVHVIGRYEKDPAWPDTVWDHPIKSPYTPYEKEKVIMPWINNLENVFSRSILWRIFNLLPIGVYIAFFGIIYYFLKLIHVKGFHDAF